MKNKIEANQIYDQFPNAQIGEGTIIEPDVYLGFRYHCDCGKCKIGKQGILRKGTIIYGDVSIGDYFQTGHYAVIRAKVKAGNYCTVSNHSVLEGIIRMGNGARIMSHVYIPTRTWFGDNVFVGPNVTFLNDKNVCRYDEPETPRGAVIADDVVIGGGATILPAITIGQGSFIAAGTLVTKNIPPKSFVKGTPGKIMKLPDQLNKPNNRQVTIQPLDIWHPMLESIQGLDWPNDWPERFAL